ncbi:hypothetical protein [Rubrobacter calidifluminis]|uniref:hypothetical protein n=1 Tax=Rubrobacter calidifluminis TaxID=1392640 RepID=UPI00236251E3|nr:hypothetical protein [Rubrobacter calidifluminis]
MGFWKTLSVYLGGREQAPLDEAARARVLRLLEEGKGTEAVREYRRSTGARLKTALSEVKVIERGL